MGPKKPTGGAFGQFLNTKRAEIVASLPAGHKITDVTKKAGELFKALSEGEKKKYQGLYVSEAILKKARGLGYEDQIQKLAKRPDVVSSGKSPADLLAALVDAQGLVNPAKRALLGA